MRELRQAHKRNKKRERKRERKRKRKCKRKEKRKRKATHMAWEKRGNQRTATAQWRRTRAKAKQALPYACQHAHKGPCRGRLELDHIHSHKEGGSDNLDNLQWLCALHHKNKTQQEAARARDRKRSLANFPRETHPGIKPPTPHPRNRKHT